MMSFRAIARVATKLCQTPIETWRVIVKLRKPTLKLKQ